MGLFSKKVDKPAEPDPAAQPAQSQKPAPDPRSKPSKGQPPPDKRGDQPVKEPGSQQISRQNSTYPERGLKSKQVSVKGGLEEGKLSAPLKKQGSKVETDKKKNAVGRGEDKSEEPSKDSKEEKRNASNKKGPPDSEHKKPAGKSTAVSRMQSLVVDDELDGPEDGPSNNRDAPAQADPKKAGKDKKRVEEERPDRKTAKSAAVSTKSAKVQPLPPVDTRPPKPDRRQAPPPTRLPPVDSHRYVSDPDADEEDSDPRRRRQHTHEHAAPARRRRPGSEMNMKSPSRVLLAKAAVGGMENAQAANALRVYYKGKLESERRKFMSLNQEKVTLVGRVKNLEIEVAKAKSGTLREARPQEGKLILDLRFQIKMQNLEISKLKETIHSMEKRIEGEAKTNARLQHAIENQKETGARHASVKKSELDAIVKDRGELETKFRNLQVELEKERRGKDWKGANRYAAEKERTETIHESLRNEDSEDQSATRRKPRAVVARANDE